MHRISRIVKDLLRSVTAPLITRHYSSFSVVCHACQARKQRPHQLDVMPAVIWAIMLTKCPDMRFFTDPSSAASRQCWFRIDDSSVLFLQRLLLPISSRSGGIQQVVDSAPGATLDEPPTPSGLVRPGALTRRPSVRPYVRSVMSEVTRWLLNSRHRAALTCRTRKTHVTTGTCWCDVISRDKLT